MADIGATLQPLRTTRLHSGGWGFADIYMGWWVWGTSDPCPSNNFKLEEFLSISIKPIYLYVSHVLPGTSSEATHCYSAKTYTTTFYVQMNKINMHSINDKIISKSAAGRVPASAVLLASGHFWMTACVQLCCRAAEEPQVPMINQGAIEGGRALSAPLLHPCLWQH